MNLGIWNIDDYLTFTCNTHRFDTGAATDADSVPTYRIYKDETVTPILTGSMAPIDSFNTTGFYSKQVQLTTANGFEVGKSYNIYISATVNGITGTTSRTFQMSYNLYSILTDVDTGTTLPGIIAINAKQDQILAAISGLSGGAGAYEYVITVKIGTDPLDNARVWISSDSSGATIVAGSLYTNSSGEATFYLDAGTYYAWIEHSGYNFTNPQEFEVTVA